MAGPWLSFFVVAYEGGEYQWTGPATCLAAWLAGMPIVGVKVGDHLIVVDRIAARLDGGLLHAHSNWFSV